MTANTQWIACNACGTDDFEPLSEVDGWKIGRCRQCTMVYLNPMPFFEPSTDFSDISMDFQYTRFQHEIDADVLEHDRRQFRSHVEAMTRLAGKPVGPGKFLDVGCGSGSSVRAAVDEGWEGVGVDIDTRLIELGRAKLDVDIRNTPLLESGLEAGTFDFIRFRDVIEHLPNPYETLTEAKRLLSPGGFALIATPNEDGLPTQVRLKMGMKRNKIATVNPPHHVHGFTPATLGRLLERVGLEVCELGTTTPVNPEYVTARNMQSARNPVFVAIWELLQKMGRGSMLTTWVRKPIQS